MNSDGKKLLILPRWSLMICYGNQTYSIKGNEAFNLTHVSLLYSPMMNLSQMAALIFSGILEIQWAMDETGTEATTRSCRCSNDQCALPPADAITELSANNR